MGHGIAQVSAMIGCLVRLFDANNNATSAGMDKIRDNLDKGISRGKLTEDVRNRTLENITATGSISEAVTGADLVVEAAPEAIDLKESIFAEVESSVPDHAILATNTSSLSIARISSSLRSPSRFVGMHFFNPVHIMALVEVVWGPQTSDATLEAAVRFARRLGKEPIVVRDAPGFASSRLGIVLGMEAIRMVEQGVASPEDIDKAMELGYRHPMGPLELTDLVGLDVRLAIAEYLHKEVGEQFRPPALLRKMVRAGKLGKKSGQGFYSW